MPLQSTSGAASYDAFGGGVAAVPKYIEDYFSTFLYSATGATQNIVNNIDLSTKGGLVWIKDRTLAYNNCLFDTSRGVGKTLYSNTTNAQVTDTPSLTNFNTNGFSLGADSTFGYVNNAGNLVSWSIAKAPKFFDVVTWTGSGANRTIAHNLGSVPGCIIVKRTDTTADWTVYHRSLTSAAYSVPLTVYMPASTPTVWNNTAPTSTVFSVGTDATVNASGGTYVAYIYAHDAAGFGLLGTDNVISCGSFTTDGSGVATVNLGYEPQWILMKRTNDYDNWYLIDNMRGWTANATSNSVLGIYANSSGAENAYSNTALQLTSTGFNAKLNTSSSFIYIAIRRGPMKVPTSGTSVFSPYITTSVANSGTTYTSADLYSTGFVTDIILQRNKSGTDGWYMGTRLQGTKYLKTETTAAEVTTSAFVYDSNIGAAGFNASYGLYAWKRAPSAFDVVCYTGTGSATTQTHNLGVVPEFMIVKVRSTSSVNWSCYHSALGNTQVISLNEDIQAYTNSQWNNTTPTSTVFSVGTQTNVNGSGQTYVAYLFATCAGVSKVGSYTGTATTKQIDCGFTGGARFVLIKRTDEVASGNPWYVWDSARGIVAGNDPYLLLNSTAAEVTSTDYVDTYSAGFEISSTAPAAINASGGSFIFLAVA